MPSTSERIQQALLPLCVEHLQELRDFGCPPLVAEALTLTMRVVRGDEAASCEDAFAMWANPPHGFDKGLRRFIAMMNAYEPTTGPHSWDDDVLEFVAGEGSEQRRAFLNPDQQGVGAVLFDFLLVLVDTHDSASPDGNGSTGSVVRPRSGYRQEKSAD